MKIYILITEFQITIPLRVKKLFPFFIMNEILLANQIKSWKKANKKRNRKLHFGDLFSMQIVQTNNLKNTEKVCISIKNNYNIILISEKNVLKIWKYAIIAQKIFSSLVKQI